MYIGIDLGGTNIKAGLVDKEGKIITNLSFPTESSKGWAHVFSNIEKVIKKLLESDGVKGIGVGIPGPVDSKSGIIREMPAIPGAKNIPIVKELDKIFPLPVFVDNDANNFTRGEFIFGVAKGKKNVIGITLGTGIGGGILINGELYTGSSNYAGEVGHIVIVPSGIQCNCGKFGCWEAYGSATAVIKKALSYKKRNIDTKLKELPEIEAKDVFDLAKQGDIFCESIVNETSYYIGLGIASLVNTLNPEMIVIGGGMSLAGDYLLDKIRKIALENILPPLREGLEIEFSKFGTTAGIMGAAALAKMNLE